MFICCWFGEVQSSQSDVTAFTLTADVSNLIELESIYKCYQRQHYKDTTQSQEHQLHSLRTEENILELN